MRRVELYYDFVCPYAYLASRRIDALAERVGVAIEHVPMLLGGVFRAIGTPNIPMDAVNASKAAYMRLELERSARLAGVALKKPKGHPRRTVLALRAALASDDLPRASHALFAAYWAEGRDLEDPAEVLGALERAELDGAGAVRRASSDAIKRRLFENTERAVARGVFGAPSLVVVDDDRADLFWGHDRLDFVERALARSDRPAPDGPPTPRPATGRVIELFFDYSSPFAYLAATQLDALERRTGATVVLKPLLLGGLFRDLGTPDVPLFEMPESKRRYQLRELALWADHYGVPFRFPTRFPLSSVKALRLTLCCPGERRRDLALALFRAAWVDDRDLSADSELTAIVREVGLDPTPLLADLASPAVKAQLRASTDEARARRIFGVPTFAAGDELFWGQDKIGALTATLLKEA
ncbi:MAG: 2-hydroxychromene-2-carboxylate isomerase [Polyangiaceae bacterium]|jgi:2-hydroxychromene-2-carboxylate isomerase|nr:2-hydroxychromene-2-carboxylate isomerase [Polyangiaceae bacterium]